MRWSIQLFRCPALLNHRRIVSWDGTLVCVMADFKIETRLWLVYLNRTCVHILSNSLVHQLSPLSLFSTMAHSNMFVLPDIISFCQAPKPVSPHYEQVAAEAKQWLSDGVHIEGPVVENLLASNVGLLVCTTYPGAGLAELRACTDFINMCYSLDDLAEEVDHHMMEVVSRSVIGSMREPHTFKSMDMFGKMTQSMLDDCFW